MNDSGRWRTELARLKAAFSSAVVKRPFVTVSFAMSEDRCLSSTRGAPSSLSSAAALQVTHELRATHDALLVGVGTVLSDDPVLTARLANGPSPRRVVLDSHLRVPSDARLLSSTSVPALLLTTPDAATSREEELRAAGAEIVRVRAGPGGVALLDALRALHVWGVGSLMVEGGAEVLESFVGSGLVDFCLVTIAPGRLENPSAVRLGPVARAALADWKVPREVVGGDTLLSGAFHAPLKAAS